MKEPADGRPLPAGSTPDAPDMSTPGLHPRVPRGRVTAMERDLLLLQRASEAIAEFGQQLDSALASEARPAERLRMVREATNRITRTANDAIDAYRRAQRTLETQASRGGTSEEAVAGVRDRLSAARLELLAALEHARLRYPATPGDAPATPTVPARRTRRSTE